MTTKVLTAKQVRWMELLNQFNFKIVYTEAKNNQKADILSRREQDLLDEYKYNFTHEYIQKNCLKHILA